MHLNLNELYTLYYNYKNIGFLYFNSRMEYKTEQGCFSSLREKGVVGNSKTHNKTLTFLSCKSCVYPVVKPV